MKPTYEDIQEFKTLIHSIPKRNLTLEKLRLKDELKAVEEQQKLLGNHVEVNAVLEASN